MIGIVGHGRALVSQIGRQGLHRIMRSSKSCGSEKDCQWRNTDEACENICMQTKLKSSKKV
jgi:hypothetical protein